MKKGFTRNFKPLEILTEEQIEAIHRGTLDVLENTGIRIEHERALKLFEKNDCKVDYDDMRVRMPSGLVEECLRKAPSSFHVKARDGKDDIRVGGNTVYFNTFAGQRIVDLDTWERRAATRQEKADAVTVLDALENIHLLGSYTPYFEVEGIPSPMAIPESVAYKIRHSTKPQTTGYQLDCEVFNIEMAKAVGIEIIMISLAAAPLAFRYDAVECAFRCVEAGFPLYVGGGVMMGATGPATIAGATVINNAQHISGIVLAQLLRPGTRVILSEFTPSQDMRSGTPVFGSADTFLHLAVFNQYWRRFGVPTSTPMPGATNSKSLDYQAGYEKGNGALVAALTGSHIIKLYGGLDRELAWHPVVAILDDDIAGMIGRFIEGVQVNDETLAIDLINEVGPIPGMYLDKAHTREWWKKEQFLPQVADWLTYTDWLEQGKKGALDNAKDRMEQILATHKPKPLTPEQDNEIERILEQARESYRKKGMM